MSVLSVHTWGGGQPKEDICEEGPNVWEQKTVDREWNDYVHSQGEAQDSVSGEVLDPKKVKEGCDEELGFMTTPMVWDSSAERCSSR